MRVHIEHHIEVDGFYYSNPYQRVKQPLDGSVIAELVGFFHKRQCVASHMRSDLERSRTTVNAFTTKAHCGYANRTRQRLVRGVEQTGPAIAGVIAHIVAHQRCAWRRPAGAPLAVRPVVTKASGRSSSAASTQRSPRSAGVARGSP